ncbi:uncharacterized protein LOC111716862 [Eurytemora carolleeae]|uniref:uncharacterized protein LOC111716862 n=1 Tax=Eurytemora carolleeae TaxID=1294199 RepID=UPI000C76AD49|nr:uncharacterized protein LOC111716862 [Eurytemora carolleeae]|eukprot:XP_023348137.1 uncharacterized protein LOC111716862 [Eurytemora affinis]
MLSSNQDAAGNFVLTSGGDIARNFVLSSSVDGNKGNFVLSSALDGNKGSFLLNSSVDGSRGNLMLNSLADGNKGNFVLNSSADGNKGNFVFSSSADVSKGNFVLSSSADVSKGNFVLSSSADASKGNFLISSSVDASKGNFVLSSSVDENRGSFVLSNGKSNGAKLVSLSASPPGIQKPVNSSTPDLVLHPANQLSSENYKRLNLSPAKIYNGGPPPGTPITPGTQIILSEGVASGVTKLSLSPSVSLPLDSTSPPRIFHTVSSTPFSSGTVFLSPSSKGITTSAISNLILTPGNPIFSNSSNPVSSLKTFQPSLSTPLPALSTPSVSVSMIEMKKRDNIDKIDLSEPESKRIRLEPPAGVTQ